MFSSVDDVLKFVKFLIDIGVPLANWVADVVRDWSDDKITAEEADAIAEGKFSAMMALPDPRDASKARGEETMRRLKEKFDVSDESDGGKKE